MTYAVMVKWNNESKAQRLGHGETVKNKKTARRFRTRLAAEFAIRTEVSRAEGVERAWVAAF